jgi:glyoxylase-like metal-dependent hydrolase (beta-lactamase superfamily II)
MQWNIGETLVTLISAGAFVDEASMFFGSAYASQKITLALNCLLIHSSGKLLLVDTGFGNKPGSCDDVEFVPGASDLFQELQNLGIAPGDIDVVINTHLHADHCGGNTIAVQDALRPAFVNAEYWIQQGEWTEALGLKGWQRTLYRTENFVVLEARHTIRWLHGDTQVTPEVRCLIAPGHTSWHQCVEVSSSGQSLVFLGDLAPTHYHLERPTLRSEVDLLSEVSTQSRRRFCQQAVTKKSIVILSHEPDAGRLVNDINQEEEFRFEPFTV